MSSIQHLRLANGKTVCGRNASDYRTVTELKSCTCQACIRSAAAHNFRR